MAEWPDKFPLPQRKQYSASAELPFVQSAFPSGSKRRRIDETTEQVYSLVVIFPDSDFPYFWAWVRHKLNEGVEMITGLPFRDDDVLHEINCYLDKTSIQHRLVGNKFYVSFSVRVDQVTTPSESALDTWLAS